MKNESNMNSNQYNNRCFEEMCQAGIRCYQESHLDDAIKIFGSILQEDPCHARALNALAIIFNEEGDCERAHTYVDRLLAAHPAFEKGYNTQGLIFLKQEKTSEAKESFKTAVTLNPSFIEPMGNLGDLYLRLREWDEAIDFFRRVIELSPDSFKAHYAEGVALSSKHQDKEAVRSLHEALRIKPDFVDAYVALLTPLKRLGMLRDMVNTCETALRLKPESPHIHNILGNFQLAQGVIEQAVHHYRQALKHNPESSADHSNIIMAMYYSGSYSPAEILKESRQWERQFAHEKVTVHEPSGDTRIRIGYVSPDFKHHVLSFFFEPLLAAHDHSRFCIYCYSDVAEPDGKTTELAAMADCWVDIAGMPDKEVAERISADGIDILVDLAGHTGNNRLRLFTMKPVSVQASWLGYPGTTGLKMMDYRISDSVADPVGATECFHTEKILRLPNCFLTYAPPVGGPPVSPLPAHTQGGVTFGSFNNLAKVTPEVIAAWSKILNRVPNSRLLLKNQWFSDDVTCSRYYKLLEGEGVDRFRIQLLPHTRGTWHHLARYWKMDVSLDTFPYNGTTTTFESLWMGVPVIALAGGHHAARVSASILSHLGLHDLVAESLEAYIDKAVELAHDLKFVYHLRQTLRQCLADSALCDSVAFARQMEEAYVAMLGRK